MMVHSINSIVSLSFFLAMKWKTVLTVVNLTCVCDQLQLTKSSNDFASLLITYLYFPNANVTLSPISINGAHSETSVKPLSLIHFVAS